MSWNSIGCENAYLKYGLASGELAFQTPVAFTTTFSKDEMCGAPANSVGWHEPGTWFHALANTKPSTNYIFMVGCGDGDGDGNWSEEMVFNSPPVVAATSRTRIITFGGIWVTKICGDIAAECSITYRYG